MEPDLVDGGKYAHAHFIQCLLTPARKGRLSEMLCAFLSKDCIESVQSVLSLDSRAMEKPDNLWLSSVAAFELVEAGEMWFKFRRWGHHDLPHRESVGHD